MIDKLNITITKTADGLCDYVQLMSDDTMSINVVVVALKIEVRDTRAADTKPLKQLQPHAENSGDIRRKGTSPIIGRAGLERAMKGKR